MVSVLVLSCDMLLLLFHFSIYFSFVKLEFVCAAFKNIPVLHLLLYDLQLLIIIVYVYSSLSMYLCIQEYLHSNEKYWYTLSSSLLSGQILHHRNKRLCNQLWTLCHLGDCLKQGILLWRENTTIMVDYCIYWSNFVVWFQWSCYRVQPAYYHLHV